MAISTLEPEQDEQQESDSENQVSKTPAEMLERIPTMSDEEGDELDRQRFGGDSGSVYDEPGNVPSKSDKEGSDNDKLDSARSKEENAQDNDASDAGQEEREQLASRTGHEQQLGKGYTGKSGDSNKKPGFMQRQLGKQNRIFLLGGSGAVLIVAVAMAIFFALLPLKIMHIVNNLQSRFFATSESAVQKETGVLVSDYMRKYVFPALRVCTGHVDKSCTPNIRGSSMVKQLYKGWANARLEDKLSQKYGLEFKYNPSSRVFYLKTPGMTGDGVDLNEFANTPGETLDDALAKSNSPEFKRVSRSELRGNFKSAMTDETKWKQAMYRFRAGKLLSQKYGLKRCIIACNSRDNFADWKDSKVQAAKIIFAQRVLEPRSQLLGVVVGCIVDDCTSTHTENGQKLTAFDGKVQDALDKAAARYGEEAVADMIKTANAISEKGFTKYAAGKAVETLATHFPGGDGPATTAAGDIAEKAVPVLGWVNLSAKLVGMGSKIGPEIRHYSYAVNSAAMVNTYMIYRTYADECKSNRCDLSMMGSFVDSLGSGNDSSYGGKASAEQTPLYNKLFNGETSAQNTALSNLSGKAYAASALEKCNNGPLPPGATVCPELVLGTGSGVADTISNFFNSGIMQPVTWLAKFWNASAGAVISSVSGIFGSIIQGIPGFSDITNLIAQAASPAIHAVTDYVVPQVTSDNNGGGRNFELAAGGADVSGAHFAHYGLGGQALSDKQASLIIAEQQQQDQQAFDSKTLLAKIFDTNSDQSLVTKLAVAMPGSPSQAMNSVASIFSNPVGKLSHLFGSMFNFGRASAASTPAQSDPFGVTQYGVPSGNSTLAAANQDPDAYWTTECSSDGTTIDWNKPVNKNWQDSATTDPNTGEQVNSSVNPCLLLQTTVSSAGALFDSALANEGSY